MQTGGQPGGGGVVGGVAAGVLCVAAVLELDVCTDVVLVVTVVGRPPLNTLEAGLLNSPPPVDAAPVPDGLVPAKPVPEGPVPVGTIGTGPGAVEPGAGDELGVIETVVVVFRLLAVEALFVVPGDAPPLWPGWLWSCWVLAFICCWVVTVIVGRLAPSEVPVCPCGMVKVWPAPGPVVGLIVTTPKAFDA